MIGNGEQDACDRQQSLVRRWRLVAMRGGAHASDLHWSEPDGTGCCVAELTPAARECGACARCFVDCIADCDVVCVAGRLGDHLRARSRRASRPR